MGDVDRIGVSGRVARGRELIVMLVLGLVLLGGLGGCKRELKRFAFAPTMTLDDVAVTDPDGAQLIREVSAIAPNMSHEETFERLELLHPVTRKPFLVIRNRSALIWFAVDWGLQMTLQASQDVGVDEALSVYRGFAGSQLSCQQVSLLRSSRPFSDLERGHPCSRSAKWSAQLRCKLPMDNSAVVADLDVFCESDPELGAASTLRYNILYGVSFSWIIKRYEAKYGPLTE